MREIYLFPGEMTKKLAAYPVTLPFYWSFHPFNC